MLKKRRKNKPTIAELGHNYELLQDPKKQLRETNFKLLQIMEASTSIIGAALAFTTLFAGFVACLNIPSTIQTIALLITGGILGYSTFILSKHK